MNPRNLITALALLTALAAAPAVSSAADATAPGLVGEYFNEGTEIPEGGKPFLVRVDKQVEFNDDGGNFARSKLGENFAVRWTGVLRITDPGEYTFFATSDDGSRVLIDDRVVVDHWGMHGSSEKSGTVPLAAGDHPIRIEYMQGSGGATCVVSWQPPGGAKQVLPAGVLFHAKVAANIPFDAEKWKKYRPGSSGGTTNKNSPWGRMDYGPFLAHSIGAPQPSDNTTLKGVAIKLQGGGAQVDANAGVLFDTQLMRYSAGWTGSEFLILKGVAFDGAHGPIPEVGGDVKFGTSQGPGWARPGTADFKDPRPEPFGPLPKDWLRYRGLYVSGNRVALSYTVGDMDVLESPGVEAAAEPAFSRTFNVGPSAKANTLLVCELDGGGGGVGPAGTNPGGDKTGPAEGNMAVIESGDFANAAGLNSAPKGAAWTVVSANNKARIHLTVPAHNEPLAFTLVVWGGNKTDLANVNLANGAGSKPADLQPLARGGPARWTETVTTAGKLGDADAKAGDKDATAPAYIVDTLTVPEENPYKAWMRTGGFDFFEDGRSAALCTWSGDVWVVSGIDPHLEKLTWKRFATGLFQPLGLKIVDGKVYVHGRDQITRLHDLNGDNEADFYENFNNDVSITTGFHEFSFDLQTDPQGNFYFIKGGPVNPGGGGFGKLVPHHGTLMRVSKDGAKLDVVATGFRAPNGMGVGPEGQLTSGDNEGTWTPMCRLNWIKPGGFYGVVDLAQQTTPPTQTENPLCWFPKAIDNSSGGQVWVTSDKWGPFTGDLLHLSYGQCRLFKVLKDEVGGQIQGGVVAFPLKFDSGVMRGRFNPADGQLYLVGLRGWQTSAARDSAFHRVRYTGAPANMPTAMHVTDTGIDLTFTDPLNPELANDAESYTIEQWNYRWTGGYGSPEVKVSNGEEQGRDTVAVKSAMLSADGKTVSLEIPDLRPVMQMQIEYDLETAEGAEVVGPIYATINAVGDKRLVVTKDKPSGEVK